MELEISTVGNFMTIMVGAELHTAVAECGKKRILVVEDDKDFVLELTDLLERYGFHVLGVDKLANLRQALADDNPDVLILDQFVNGEDLLPELPKVRGMFSGGIIMLTGNSDPTDRILGLEGGADDFVLKASEPRELVARIRAVLRRSADPEDKAHQPPQETPLVESVGQWRLDRERRRLTAPDSQLVELTGMEFDVLLRLYDARGKIVSRDSLVREVLRRQVDCAGRSVENLISRIRSKVRPHLASADFIKSVRGQGYVFVGFV